MDFEHQRAKYKHYPHLFPMPAQILDINKFLELGAGGLIVDVRAPLEFAKGHISGAINIPLFDNAERAEIGTLYKQTGKDAAVTRGLEIVSPKLILFVNQVKALAPARKVFVYCARGGMRSNSFAWLMDTAGLQAYVLAGGYKKYRNHVLDFFSRDRKLIVLGGMTGSGKTDVLKRLKELAYQVIDLEKLANHKGSAFGTINEPRQNPQQIFENNLFHELNALDSSLPILVEDESMTIGYNKIPISFWRQMKQAPIIKLDIPFELRVKKLVEDYGTTDTDALKQAVLKIQEKLGGQKTRLCLQRLDERKLDEVAALTLAYYDKTYTYTYAQKTTQTILNLALDSLDLEENTKQVCDAIQSLLAHGL